MFASDFDETLRFLQLIHRAGSLIEVRAKGCRGAFSQRFDDLERAATYAAETTNRPETVAVWVTVNAIDPATPWPADQKSACDHNVTHRTNMIVDVDSCKPKSPDGKEQNATDAELAATRVVVERVIEYLTALGFPVPLVVCTGNGYQLWYGTDLQEPDDLVARILGSLAARFNCPGVAKIDTAVSNPARVARTVGTMNRKGADTIDRPQRMAKIVSAPDRLEVVPREVLQKAAGTVYASAPATDAPTADAADSFDAPMTPPRFDMEGFLSKGRIDYRKKRKNGGDVYEFACLFKPDARTTGGMWVFHGDDGTIRGGCHHEECQKKKVNWKKIRNKIDPTFDKAVKESFVQNVTDTEYLARQHLARHPEPFAMYHESVWRYHAGVYAEQKPEAVKRAIRRTMLAEFNRHGRQLKERGMAEVQPPSVTEKIVSSVYGVLTSIIPEVDQRYAMPCWLDGSKADNRLVCANGILNLDTLTLEPHTPHLFSAIKLPYAYDPAATCPTWHTFLLSVWPDEPEAIQLVQECVGYTLLGANTLQVMFLLQGAPRGGKGTVIRTACKVVGKENTCSISVRNFVKDFALWGARGKSIIVIPDIHAPKHGLPPEIVEILKAVTGADAIDINGKGRDIVTEPLPGKVFAATNDLLTFTDDSGAFFDRLVGLKFTRSFYRPDHPDYVEGQEQDPDLELKLEGELTGILNWALQGLKRVQARKRFTQPASSIALRNALSEEGAPIKRYVSDRLIHVPSSGLLVDEVFDSWSAWCTAHEVDEGTRRGFGKLLLAACPWIKRQKVSSGIEPRPHEYRGIAFRSAVPVQ
jgi:putative DNA primase/helicase